MILFSYNGVRLMSELKREGVGTAEIEAMAQKRVQQRNDKNGIKEGKQNDFIPQGIQRDVSHIEKQLEIRRLETREDWEVCRDKFWKLRRDIKSATRNSKEKNYVEKELKKMYSKFNTQYQETSAKHDQKVAHLSRKFKASHPRKVLKAKNWVTEAAEGNPGEWVPPPVPVYGEVSVTKEEEAAARLPPKFPTLAKITKQSVAYETTLCQTKIRYHRRPNGSPTEQILAQEAGELDVPTDEQAVEENKHRDI